MRSEAGFLHWAASGLAVLVVGLTALPGLAQTSQPPEAAQPAAPDGIVINDTAVGSEAHVQIGDCAVRLEYRPQQKAAAYRDVCRRPAGDKLATLMQLLGAVFDHMKESPPPEQLIVSVGRIVQTFPDVAAEIVVAAASTSGWDGDAARRSAPVANALMVRLLTRTEGGTAMRTAEAPAGLKVTGFAVDKVLTARPQRLPFALPPHVVSANSDNELPFDAMLWIALRRE